jgi:DNA polymerase
MVEPLILAAAAPPSPLAQEFAADWCVNKRGFRIDTELLQKGIALADEVEQGAQAELKQLTGGEITSAHQRDRLLSWLAGRGCEVENCEKSTLQVALQRQGLDSAARRAIELRLTAAHPAANKMRALLRWCCDDGRVRGAFQLFGAATGRWSSPGVQAHNFSREGEKLAAKVSAVLNGDLAAVQQLGNPLEILGEILRAAVCAEPGHRLLVADFSGVESVGLAWIADEDRKLQQWSRYFYTREPGDDPYFLLGKSLGFPDETARKYGKIADLAFGFQGGLGAAKNFGLGEIAADCEIEAFKRAYRAAHPNIEQFWDGIDRAAVAAVRRAPASIRYGRLMLHCERQNGASFLYITLPSGRRLTYPFARLISNRFGRPAVEFMDNSLPNGGWTPCNLGRGAYGGLWTENIVQAVARDLLAAAIVRLEAADYPVVAHVHDEVICEVPIGGSHNAQEFQYIVNLRPEWAKGVPHG